MSKTIYSESEIISRYKKNPTREMITILSELNNCPKADIEDVLIKNGIDISKPKKKSVSKKNEVVIPESVRQMINSRIEELNIQIHKATTYIEEYKKDIVAYDHELKQLQVLMEIS